MNISYETITTRISSAFGHTDHVSLVKKTQEKPIRYYPSLTAHVKADENFFFKRSFMRNERSYWYKGSLELRYGEYKTHRCPQQVYTQLVDWDSVEETLWMW